jgi:hypothetical protein
LIEQSDGAIYQPKMDLVGIRTMEHCRRWGIVKDVYKAVPANARLAGNFGGLFIGERGWLTNMSGSGPLEASPESLFEEMGIIRTPEVNIGSNTHHANWLECIHSRKATSANAEIGHRGASIGHLANIATLTGRSLKWDPVEERFAGDEVANRLLSRALRAPWRIVPDEVKDNSKKIAAYWKTLCVKYPMAKEPARKSA